MERSKEIVARDTHEKVRKLKSRARYAETPLRISSTPRSAALYGRRFSPRPFPVDDEQLTFVHPARNTVVRILRSVESDLSHVVRLRSRRDVVHVVAVDEDQARVGRGPPCGRYFSRPVIRIQQRHLFAEDEIQSLLSISVQRREPNSYLTHTM